MSLFPLKLLLTTFLLAFLMYFVKKVRHQQILLLLANYFFYACLDWRFLGLLITITFVSWFTAQRNQTSRSMLWLGVGMPFLCLGIAKYLNFFRDAVYAILQIQSAGSLNILLPIGISFYTFLAVSYVLDVYHGKIPAEKSYIPVALYITFFPTIISGPITKARDLINQFKEKKVIDFKEIQAGIQIFIIGCLKKSVIADRLGVLVDDVYAAPLAFDSATVWLAVIAYSMQLYFDFAGYSDMVIGCARCLGFRLSQNFNLPYLAQSIAEFWKRWHISLSSWLQEYFYIALGGNRCGIFKSYRNLLITMLCCGLWHGAGWTFVFWGGGHGILLCVHRFWKNWCGNSVKLPLLLKILLTDFAVTMCWICFRADDVQTIRDIFYRLYVWESFGVHQMYVYAWIALALLFLVSVYSVYNTSGQGLEPIMDITKPFYFFVFCFEIFLLLGLMYTDGNPFVYATF